MTQEPPSLTSFMDGLAEKPVTPETPRRSVQSLDNTGERAAYPSVEDYDGVDRLFGSSPSYRHYVKEKPEHRLILWATIQGHKPAEVATLLRMPVGTVYAVRAQAWFKEAFCRVTSDIGKDMFQTTLKGFALPALERVEELSRTADSDAVKLSANREILDRFLGKATVKVEQKVSGQIDSVVYDAVALMEQDRQLSEQLKARGLGGNN